MENEDIVYSVMEAAKLLKVGKNKVYALIKAGLLPALNLGGIKIRRQTLLNFLEIYENYDLTDVNNIVPFNCAATAYLTKRHTDIILSVVPLFFCAVSTN